jgi:hypothetical protein
MRVSSTDGAPRTAHHPDVGDPDRTAQPDLADQVRDIVRQSDPGPEVAPKRPDPDAVVAEPVLIATL